MPLRVAPYRRKIAGGTACNVVPSPVADEAAGQPDAGNRNLKGRSLCFEHAGQFPPMPPVPPAVPARRLAPGALAVQEGKAGRNSGGSD